MKKLLLAVFVLAASGWLCLPASGSAVAGREIDVTARYKTVSTVPVSYSVDLYWSDMTFTYTKEETLIWDAGNHSYHSHSSGSWDKTCAELTVVNHSNVDVFVAVTYLPVADTGIIGTVENGTGTLKAGVAGDYDGADRMTAMLTISGTPVNAAADSEIKIGTLKVTIQ